MAPYLNSWRDGWQGRSPMVVRPASTQEVVAVVTLCHEARTPIVPQAGNTGLTGGSTPSMSGNEIVLPVGRMNRVCEVDRPNDTMRVDAGSVLANLEQKAQEVDRLFPLSLDAEDTCQIGGNLSTNAGGINVFRLRSPDTPCQPVCCLLPVRLKEGCHVPLPSFRCNWRCYCPPR